MSRGRTLSLKFQIFVSFVSSCETCSTDVLFHFRWAQGEVYRDLWLFEALYSKATLFAWMNRMFRNVSTRTLEAKGAFFWGDLDQDQ